jgi:hypothetical protein
VVQHLLLHHHTAYVIALQQRLVQLNPKAGFFNAEYFEIAAAHKNTVDQSRLHTAHA